jgi:lipopolysaccharide transport system permease protein
MKFLNQNYQALKILSSYRGRLWDGVIQDVKQRYVGSLFGSLWAFIFPLMQLSIYGVLYTIVFKIRVPGLSEMGYVLLVFSGLVPLIAFNEALMGATSSLISNKSLLLNTVFPAELIPVRVALSSHVTSLVALFITLILGLLLGMTNWIALLLIPVFWILLIMFAIGLGWIFSLFSLVSRDLQHGLGLVIMMLFMLSPFAYTPEMVPSGLRPIIYLNPLSYFVLVFQKIICYGELPDLLPTVGSIFLGVTTFLAGFNLFQKAKFTFFDYA